MDTQEAVSGDESSDINLTPMLDVVFIMLIFFLVTASFVRETGIEVDRPETQEVSVDEAEAILIAISGVSEIWMDNRMIDPRAVRANIERKRAELPDAPVVIRAAKSSRNEVLVQVMDASRQAGIYDISIADTPADTPE
jgi:biopolymer transport protein ExbD